MFELYIYSCQIITHKPQKCLISSSFSLENQFYLWRSCLRLIDIQTDNRNFSLFNDPNFCRPNTALCKNESIVPHCANASREVRLPVRTASSFPHLECTLIWRRGWRLNWIQRNSVLWQVIRRICIKRRKVSTG